MTPALQLYLSVLVPVAGCLAITGVVRALEWWRGDDGTIADTIDERMRHGE